MAKRDRFGNASEVVRAVRLLEKPETKLAALRTALIEGEQSGPSAAFDIEVFVARKRTSASPASC